MGFIADRAGTGLRAVLTCDAPGCTAEIGFDQVDTASTVALPPRTADPSPILFACSPVCERALVARAPNEAGRLELAMWWETMGSVMGLTDDVGPGDELSPDEIVATIRLLEETAQRHWTPEELQLSDVFTCGYLSRQHVVEALADVKGQQ